MQKEQHCLLASLTYGSQTKIYYALIARPSKTNTISAHKALRLQNPDGFCGINFGKKLEKD